MHDGNSVKSKLKAAAVIYAFGPTRARSAQSAVVRRTTIVAAAGHLPTPCSTAGTIVARNGPEARQ